MPDRNYYVALARRAAQRAGIDPDLFVRQINQESGFAEDVITGRRASSAGAQGIAQIVPKYHPNVNPLDPEAALDYAATWMSQLIKQYGGDWAKALAVYNGGVGALQQLQAGKPYDETRQYLTSILGGLGPHVAEAAELDQTTPTDGGRGGSVASNAPTVSPSQRIFDQVVAAKGDPISVVPHDPQVDEVVGGVQTGRKVPNPRPVFRYTFSDNTYIDVAHEARNQSGVAAELEVRGGTALASVAKPGAGGSVIGGQTPNEQYIVTVKPDGSVTQSPNPNYVPPTAAKPPNNKQVVTRNGKSYIYDPDTNTFTPASGLPDETKSPTPINTSASEPYIVRANPDGTISQVPNPNYVAPKADKPVRTTHTVGGRAFTLDENGNVLNSTDLRSPQAVAKEGVDLETAQADLAGKRQELLPKQQQILQGHLETVKYVQGMLERGEIDQSQADAYVALSKQAAESALKGFTPFDEMKEKREADQARQRMGTDLLTQRLSSGAGLASSLLSSATSLAGHAMLRPGQTGLGVDPLAQLMPILSQLQGGSDITPFARGLLMGGQQGPPGVSGPLPAGL